MTFLMTMLMAVADAADCRHDLIASVRYPNAPNAHVSLKSDQLNTGDTTTFVYSRDRTIEDILTLGKVGPHSLAFRLFRPRRLTGHRVLDLGCGGGRAVDQMSAKGVDITGVDLLLEEHQLRKTNYHCADIRRTGLPSGRYDRILSSFSIFYYASSAASLAAALDEIKRLLAPRGFVLIVGMDFRTTRLFDELALAAGLVTVERTGNRAYVLRAIADQ